MGIFNWWKPKPKEKIETIPAPKLPPIDIREGDKPGEAVERARRRYGGGGSGGTQQPTINLPEVEETKEIPGGTEIGATDYKPDTSKVSYFDQPGFGKELKEAVKGLGESAGYYTSFGGALNPPQDKPRFPDLTTEAPPGTLGGGTVITRPKKEEEMTPGEKFGSTVFGAGAIVSASQYAISGSIAEKYQEQIDTGLIDLPTAQKSYEEEFNLASKPIIEGYETKVKQAEFEYGGELLKAQLPYSFGRGLVFGGISALAPPVGLTLAGAELGKTAFEFEEILPTLKTYPGLSTANILSGVAGAGVGSFVTGFTVPKITGYARTFGRTEIKQSDIIDPRVLSGKQNFPTAPTKTHLKLFEESKFVLPGEKPGTGVFHGAPESFAKEFKVTKGSSELPGLYTAPSLSAYFLKLGKGYKPFGLGMESALEKSPTALRIYPKGFRTGKPQFGEPGYAYVPGIKTEIEAVIPETTKLQRLKSPYYVSYKGGRVPIQQYKVSDILYSTKKTKVSEFGNLLGSYSYKSSATPLITPSSLIYGSSSVSSVLGSYSFLSPKYSTKKLSYAPSKVSNILSFSPPKSSLRGFRTSYKPYLPSYKGGSYFGGGSSLLGGLTVPKRNWGGLPKLGIYEKIPKVKGKRRFRRQPSLISLELGLFSTKRAVGEESGLVSRPQILRSSKKRRRGNLFDMPRLI